MSVVAELTPFVFLILYRLLFIVNLVQFSVLYQNTAKYTSSMFSPSQISCPARLYFYFFFCLLLLIFFFTFFSKPRYKITAYSDFYKSHLLLRCPTSRPLTINFGKRYCLLWFGYQFIWRIKLKKILTTRMFNFKISEFWDTFTFLAQKVLRNSEKIQNSMLMIRLNGNFTHLRM